MDRIRQSLPSQLCNRIHAMVPPQRYNSADCLAWKFSNDGVFTTSSAFGKISNVGGLTTKMIFSLV